MSEPMRDGPDPRTITGEPRGAVRFWGSVCLLLCGALNAGCTTHYAIALKGVDQVYEHPTGTPVHWYPGLEPLVPREERPFVAYFSSETDLAADAPKHSHHLYFYLAPCSDLAHDVRLYNGTVFQADPTERRHPSKKEGNSAEYFYKAYIPAERNAISDFLKGDHSQDWERFVRSSELVAVCLRLGGGEMWGTDSIVTNELRLPLYLLGGSLMPSPPRRD